MRKFVERIFARYTRTDPLPSIVDSEPVVVVGAGPVGMTAALLLARQRVHSVVLEAATERAAVGSRSICVQRDVLDILSRVGVGRSIVDAGVTWYTGLIFYREHEVASITFPRSATDEFPPFVNIPQYEVERLLAEEVARNPLIELRTGHTVTGVRTDDDGVTVEASTSDGPVSVRGTHCVAADGSHSAVREALGLSFDGRSFDDKFLICDIRATLPYDVPQRRFYFDPEWNPGRQVLVHPQPDSVWRIDWQVPEDFDVDSERAGGGLDARIRRIVGDADYEVVWQSVYRFQQRRVPTMLVGKVLLAGDAAHLMSPFGARGMNSGIADAENAAWKIALDRARPATVRGGPGLLRSYDVERGAAAEENLRVTTDTMRFLVPADDTERARRVAVLERAVHDESARAEIDSGKLSEPYWYLDSPLTTGGELADFPTGPGVERPPVAGVLCPDAGLERRGRLRGAFGRGFSVLVAERSPILFEFGASDTEVIEVPEEVTETLGIGPTGAALVRPDGYLAAVLTGEDVPARLALAYRKARGW